MKISYLLFIIIIIIIIVVILIFSYSNKTLQDNPGYIQKNIPKNITCMNTESLLKVIDNINVAQQDIIKDYIEDIPITDWNIDGKYNWELDKPRIEQFYHDGQNNIYLRIVETRTKIQWCKIKYNKNNNNVLSYSMFIDNTPEFLLSLLELYKLYSENSRLLNDNIYWYNCPN